MPVDGNARLGSVPAPCIGQCSPDIESANGTHMRLTLMSHQLLAVNTFYHAGHTWRHSSGSTWSIDYVVIPSSVVHFDSWVESNIDLLM